MRCLLFIIHVATLLCLLLCFISSIRASRPTTLDTMSGKPKSDDEAAPTQDFEYNENTILLSAYKTEVKHLKIANSITKLLDFAFREWVSLTDVVLPPGLTHVGNYTFLGCVELKSVSIPSSVVEIGVGAFSHCLSLEELTLAEGLRVINDLAFNCCKSLKKIYIPSTVSELGNETFEFCESLVFVGLNDGLIYIRSECFAFCSKLLQIWIPSTVQSIGSSAFLGCRKLISVELPGRLDRIGDRAFSQCAELRNFSLPSEAHHVAGNVVHDSTSLHYIYPSENINQQLQQRFEKFPLHQLCYLQGYDSSAALLAKVESIHPEKAELLDTSGMTALHILAMSAKPNRALFQAILTICLKSFFSKADKYGSTALSYLSRNSSPEAASVLKEIIWQHAKNRFENLGLEEWKKKVSFAFDSIFDDDFRRLAKIKKFYVTLATYERHESLSLLELALWKCKMELKDIRPPTFGSWDSRKECRLFCGAQVVICNVLPFLGNLDKGSVIVLVGYA